MRKALPFLVGAAVVAGCVGLGANAAYGTPPGQEIAQNHTTVLWEYPGYPDITKPQPYVVSTRGANINSFNDVVKQPGLCGKTYQVDVYKTVVKGKNVSSLWSKGYLEYAHDGGFLAYEIGTTPYKVLTGKDTECAPTSTPTPTTPVVTPEPTPTDTPTSPPTGEPTTPPVTGSPAPTEEPSTQPPFTPEPTTQPSTGTPVPGPTDTPTSPVTSTPTTPTEPGTTAPSPTPSGPPSPVGETPAPSTAPTGSPTTQTPGAGPTASSSSTPGVPTTTQHGTTQKAHSTDDTARTLAYTGISVVGPLIAAAVLVLLGVIGAVIARKRKGL